MQGVFLVPYNYQLLMTLIFWLKAAPKVSQSISSGISNKPTHGRFKNQFASEISPVIESLRSDGVEVQCQNLTLKTEQSGHFELKLKDHPGDIAAFKQASSLLQESLRLNEEGRVHEACLLVLVQGAIMTDRAYGLPLDWVPKELSNSEWTSNQLAYVRLATTRILCIIEQMAFHAFRYTLTHNGPLWELVHHAFFAMAEGNRWINVSARSLSRLSESEMATAHFIRGYMLE
ncbi:hypothetical protein PMZ80_005592 [Knufia obscura]|uniref:Uncharacterized protein n=2 Tax=Knufia TaxID=430999 RepID=A0AAN8I396_9EURO|nr:hypothetical protein PMZ80_005592 [Knufia obscura]KAK5950059.1 hypothetical protein OHC33_009021 [Knufia fluminis]